MSGLDKSTEAFAVIEYRSVYYHGVSLRQPLETMTWGNTWISIVPHFLVYDNAV
jgi:hypothetical protein